MDTQSRPASFLSRTFRNYVQRRQARAQQVQERLYFASQRQLVWHAFKKHRLALLAVFLLAALYLLSIFADFVVPYAPLERLKNFNDTPPTTIRLINEQGRLVRPFVYQTTRELNRATFKYEYAEDRSQAHPIRFFVRTEEFKLLGLIPMNVKLFGLEDRSVPLFLFGSDRLGRDVFSRIFFAGRISLFIGFGGVILTFILGSILGGISGYYGGVVDEAIQRLIEVLISIPDIPIWIALSAALPRDWGTINIYFAITVILAIRGWTGLARVVRGKIISLREEEFALAAKAAGATDHRIIFRHLLPAFVSYLIVHVTLAIPQMILGETALSFLGLGIRPPAVSWGTLLQDAQDVTVLANLPWLLIPAAFVVVAILLFNFIGDGLRDAADPYAQR
ncbi:MAG: peptide ABC transporter permease [Trueperaceae bacterium]|jgi:peptide/nickel transport system permease protein|nr:peptide ABC transporter permease [Trueperaceae bacterium]